MKRVGESCASDGDGDTCGAVGSTCKDGKCECASGVPHLGGEVCGDANARFPGETCNQAIPDPCHDSVCSSPSENNNWYVRLTTVVFYSHTR